VSANGPSPDYSTKGFVTYFAFFDVGDQAGSVVDSRLKELANTQTSSILHTYDIARGVLHSRSSDEAQDERVPNILEMYDEMYARRIAAFARQRRFGQMYQLAPIYLTGLRSFPASQSAICHPIVSVTNLGVASVQLWIQLPAAVSPSDLVPFNDPARVLAGPVNYSLGFGKEQWTLDRGNVSTLEVMAFVAVQLLAELGVLDIAPEVRRSRAEWLKLLREARRTSGAVDSDLPALDYIETYPLYFLDYRGTQIGTRELTTLRERYASAIRGLITKDANWHLKKLEVIESKLMASECSTRDSILWFMGSQGTVKIVSNEIETDTFTSMVLAAFEVELLLGMRYFLEKINYSLNAINFEQIRPRVLAKIHRQNVERLDAFFSLASCTKDTTGERLDRLKESFGIPHLSRTTAEKISAISELVSAHYNERLQKNQSLLSILFGVFGAGQTFLSVYVWYHPFAATPSKTELGKIIAFTVLVMMLVGAAVYGWVKRTDKE
jgi:hypothetical protein